MGRGNSQRAASGFRRCGVGFDAKSVQWDWPGVTGVAMRLDPETGSHHGVYVVGAGGQVYTFLQKPTLPEVKAAGGVLEDGRVAVDIGLLRFDAEMTAALSELAGSVALPAVDLYDQITRGLTGQWKPEEDAEPFWFRLAEILHAPERPAGFHCAVVEVSSSMQERRVPFAPLQQRPAEFWTA